MTPTLSCILLFSAKKQKKKNGLKYPCCTTATVVKIILRCTYGLEIIHYEVWRVIVILRAQKKKKKKKRAKHFPLLVLPCRGVTIIKEIKDKLSEATATDRGSLVASRLYRVFYNPTREIKRNPDYKHFTWKLSEAIWLPDMSMAERNRDSMWLWRSSYEGCWAARSA